MGYGGFFKSVVRIAVPIVVGIATGGSVLAVAVSAAAATGATGGSFKESLIAGATSFIGSQVTRGLLSGFKPTAGISGVGKALSTGAATIQQVPQSALSGFAGTVAPIMDVGGGAIGQVGGIGATIVDSTTGAILAGAGAADPAMATQAAVDAAIESSQSFLNTPITDVFGEETVEAAREGVKGVSEFINVPFQTEPGKALVTGFNIIDDIGQKTLGQLGFNLDPLPPIETIGDIGARLGGKAASMWADMTLTDALNSGVPEVDEVLADTWSPEQIAVLHNEARNTLSQAAFDRMTAGVANPFLREGQTPEEEEAAIAEFNKVIGSGIERENVALGPSITESQFNTVFDNPSLGQIILSDEENLRRQAFNQEIGTAFPGDVFQTLDDDIIGSIIEERRGPAGQQISAFEARGNLNPLGGRTANMYLESQVPAAKERVSEIGSSVLGGAQRDIGAIKERAEQEASGYKLGEDLFDVAPFSTERAGLIEERQGTLGGDVREAIGVEPLFDVTGALQSAGRAQGVVSGSPSPSFLDAIAAREQASGRDRARRGLGSRGSGAF